MTLGQKRNKMSPFRKREIFWGYLFIAPSTIGFLLFILYPLIAIFVYSVYDRNLLTGEITFSGLANYQTMLFNDPLFLKTMRNSIVFTLGLVPLNVGLGLLFAVLLDRQTAVSRIFQTIFFAPVVTSAAAWSIVWMLILQGEHGVVNQALAFIGIQGPIWLFDPNASMFAVIFTRGIKGAGLSMVMFLTALANIPDHYKEAARIDGANEWHVFRHITFPLIAPTTLLVFVITTIGSLKVFDTIMLLTNGGPSNATTVLVYYIYIRAFRFFETGYSSALAVVLFLFALILTLIQWGLRRWWVYAEQ